MVEAGGIEPPSENVQLKASTGLGRDLFLVSHTPLGRVEEDQSV